MTAVNQSIDVLLDVYGPEFDPRWRETKDAFELYSLIAEATKEPAARPFPLPPEGHYRGFTLSSTGGSICPDARWEIRVYGGTITYACKNDTYFFHDNVGVEDWLKKRAMEGGCPESLFADSLDKKLT